MVFLGESDFTQQHVPSRTEATEGLCTIAFSSATITIPLARDLQVVRNLTKSCKGVERYIYI